MPESQGKSAAAPHGGTDAEAKRREQESKDAEEKAAAALKAEEAAAASEAAPRFSRDEFLANARTVTGYGKYMVAAALTNLDGEAFTVGEVKQACADLDGQPVDPDAPDNLTEAETPQGEG